jgi:hypothetical protein
VQNLHFCYRWVKRKITTSKIRSFAVTAMIFIFLLSNICFAETNENKFILPRIKSEAGDGSSINVMLRAGRFAKGEIYDEAEKSVKGDFIQEAPRQMIIVSNGIAKIATTGQMPLTVRGEFLVNNLLNLTVRGNWDGKKDGAVHMLMGKLSMFDYEFDSNSSYPLIFRMTHDGYEYQAGAGRVKDLQTGEVYILVAQEKFPNEFEGSFFDRAACEKECCALLLKGQIKQGVTIEECAKALCK